MTNSPLQSSGAFWTGVASTVASGVIIAILGFGASSLMEGFKSPPLAVVAAQLPVKFGSAFDYATPNDQIYLPDAIRSAFVATQDKMTNFEVQKARIFDLRKEKLADMISWLIAPAKSLQVVRIKNQSNKSVSNVKVKSMFAIGFIVVPETGAYALQKSKYILIDKIDPAESVTVFIWTTSDISFGLSSTISVLSSDEIVPIRLLPYTDQDISDQLIETQNIPAALFMVFLMFVGACTILFLPFFIFYQTNADFRRRHIKKDEFERMLSDVIALQDQYRPSLNLKSIAESDTDG
ncbi:MAG: hypothetical protein U1E20_14665 [Methylocystis sp.]|uniref:hypothetical protein n=1 Tax=Methylocystis sp. TaxID=1911079 RepID=UPI00395744E9